MFNLQCGNLQIAAISAILWDKDGTLADSHPYLKELAGRRSRQIDGHIPGIYDALMSTFGCSESRYDPAGLMAVGTRYENEIAAAAYVAARGRTWTESLSLVRTAFAESDRDATRKADNTPPFPGIPELLRQAYQRGLKMAVLSGDTTENIRDFLQRYELREAIDWWAGSEKPPVKPDPQMVAIACQKLEVAPHECLIIGDSGLDEQLARNSGCAGFISVTWGGSPAIAGANAVIAHPTEIQVLTSTRAT